MTWWQLACLIVAEAAAFYLGWVREDMPAFVRKPLAIISTPVIAAMFVVLVLLD